VRVVRPLLDVTHAEACAFLRSRGIGWREDETNRDTAFLRNRVRHDILPLLERTLNPAVRRTLARTADVLAGEDRWLTEIARAILEDCRAPERAALCVSRLREYRQAARRRALILWLAELGVPSACVDFDVIERVDALLKGRTGRRVDIGGALSVRRSYDRLLPAQGNARETVPEIREALPVPGEVTLCRAGLRVRTTLSPGISKPPGSTPGKLPAHASISKRAVGRKRLYVRFWRPGDRIRPPGVRGSRKLQDVFTDAKVPRERRSRIPLIECGGEIVWIAGYRVARGWEVRAAETTAIQVRMEGI
jgi:tRNA(Ile)-lysidine synthase